MDAGGVRAAHRPVPGRAAGALLPDARLGPRRRGPGAGDPGARLAGLRRVRGPRVAADLAVPDRHQRVPAGAGEPRAAGRCRPASARRATTRYGPLAAARPEVPWLQPIPDALLRVRARPIPAAIVASRASIRLALIAALQFLPARQRAVLILRDVLGWRAAEVAGCSAPRTAAVNSAAAARPGAARAGGPGRGRDPRAGRRRPARAARPVRRGVRERRRRPPSPAAARRRRAGDAADADLVRRPGALSGGSSPRGSCAEPGRVAHGPRRRQRPAGLRVLPARRRRTQACPRGAGAHHRRRGHRPHRPFNQPELFPVFRLPPVLG